MYAIKIERTTVKVFGARTGSVKCTLDCSSYKGAVSTHTTGEPVAVACAGGRVGVYGIGTGSLQCTI